MEKSNCNAVATKELFQIETRGLGFYRHPPLDLSRMTSTSRVRPWARQFSLAEDIPKEGHS